VSDECAAPGCFCTRDPDELKVKVTEITVEPSPDACKDCGYPDGSFACKIRHVSVQTGWAKRDH